MEIRTRSEQRKKNKSIRQLIRLGLFSMVSKMVVTAILLGYVYQLGAPSLSVPETTVIYSADGEVIGEQHEGQNRHWISLDEMGDHIKRATVAIEDRKFYDHHGFDMLRIGRAALTNVTAGSKLQGASTITQQYARNLYLTHDKTWVRKLNEAMYALRLEMHYTKEEILEGYLNTIYYGHGAYGIEAAANFYFGKPASSLSVSEAALLAGIPKGPGLYSPHNNPTQSYARQKLVLQAMLDTESITNKEYEQALNETVEPDAFRDFQGKRTAPYFQDAVQSFLENELGMDAATIHSSGLAIHTTLDRQQQQIAEEWIEKEMAGPYDLQVAFVAMNPANGHVQAMVGGRDYQESSFNRATQAKRQAGSTMKPLLYYAALEEGFRPNTQFKVEATDFVYDDGRKTYSPKNFNDRYADDNVTMMQALAVSDNIYAMKTHFLLGFDTLVNTVKRFGIDSPVSANPSLALGAADVSVIEMTNAYSPFANGGYGVDPTLVTRVVDRNGNDLYVADSHSERIIDPAYAFIMTDMMHGMFEMGLNDPRSGTAVTGRSLIHLLDRPIAGKSGSTSHDSWMIGYTPQLLTGVWVGNDQQLSNLPSSNEWGLYSKRIWAQFMREALADDLILPFEQPPNVTSVVINPINGKLATDACPVQRTSYFLQGTEPTEYCTDHLDGQSGKKSEPIEQEPTRFIDRFFKWFD
ncbi:transglycosylase domain-containing protein [Alteribacter aurantiacus]|uniref:transglycosylase domain-containing protein n=1 Tax=Alteribacter aurantiacus TaxID=254410 RepID=UPI00041FF09C|nr:PBP1A family penicillin-binding protein [Alteribacter aurantiacus]